MCNTHFHWKSPQLTILQELSKDAKRKSECQIWIPVSKSIWKHNFSKSNSCFNHILITSNFSLGKYLCFYRSSVGTLYTLHPVSNWKHPMEMLCPTAPSVFRKLKTRSCHANCYAAWSAFYKKLLLCCVHCGTVCIVNCVHYRVCSELSTVN